MLTRPELPYYHYNHIYTHLKSLTSKNVQRHNIYESKQTKIALKKWALLESQKIVRVGDYLLGLVGITETPPFLFGLM